MFSWQESFMLFLLVSQTLLVGKCLIRASGKILRSPPGLMESVDGSSLAEILAIKEIYERYINGPGELILRPAQTIESDQSPSQRQVAYDSNGLLRSMGSAIPGASVENILADIAPNQYRLRSSRNKNQVTINRPLTISQNHEKQLQPAQSIDQKITRNVHSVIMRQPPRFGKRSLMLGMLIKG